jgi:hypothetical protein
VALSDVTFGSLFGCSVVPVWSSVGTGFVFLPPVLPDDCFSVLSGICCLLVFVWSFSTCLLWFLPFASAGGCRRLVWFFGGTATAFGGSNRLSVGGLLGGFAGLVTDGGCLVCSFGKSCLPPWSGFVFSGHGAVVIGLLPPVPPVVPIVPTVPIVQTPRGPSLVVLMPGVVMEWEEMCMEEMAIDLLLAPSLENWSLALTAPEEGVGVLEWSLDVGGSLGVEVWGVGNGTGRRADPWEHTWSPCGGTVGEISMGET